MGAMGGSAALVFAAMDGAAPAGDVELLLGGLSGGGARGSAFAAALLLGAASAGGWELSGVVEPAGG